MSAGKALAIVGGLGTLAGVGYLIVRHVTRPDEDDEPEGTDEPEPADELADAEESAEQLADAEESAAGPDLAPLPGPAAPIPEPNGAGGRVQINKSQTDSEGTVRQSAAELLEQARKHDPSITMDELTAARLAVSEHGSGTFTELCCIVDAELNRAQRRRRSLFESLTHRGTFGKQGKTRRAATRQDPQMRHLWAARAVLSGKARGISRGATRFFDPATMDKQNARYRAWVENGRQGEKPASVTCDALTLLEAWSYDLGRQGPGRCPPDRSKRGRDTQAWVGPIPGVDPLRLMLMKPLPLGEMHDRHYQAARAVLLRGLRTKA